MKINLPLKENPQKILDDVQKKITTKGGTFCGDLNGGEFTIMGVKGNYKIINQELIIDVKSKPFFIPEAFIKEEIGRYFNAL
jgi:hypothetical protein